MKENRLILQTSNPFTLSHRKPIPAGLWKPCSLILACLVLGVFSSQSTCAKSYQGPAHILNITGDYQSIFLTHEPKTFMFRIITPASSQDPKESLILNYEVRDLDKQLLGRGSQSVRDPGNHKNWVRFTLNLPAKHNTGWFRVHLTLEQKIPNQPTRILTHSFIDMASVPTPNSDITDRYFGISEQGGYSTAMPPFTEFALPAMRRLGAKAFRFFHRVGRDAIQARRASGF